VSDKIKNKVCSKCGEEKPHDGDHFHKNGSRFRSQCKVCVLKHLREWQKIPANAAKQTARKRVWREANRETYNASRRRFYEKNKERIIAERHRKNGTKPWTKKKNRIRDNGNGTTTVFLENLGGAETIVDTHVWHEKNLEKHYWFLNKVSYGGYALASMPHPDKGYQTTRKLHQLILSIREGYQTDHINGDGLDNRLENLRECTQTENLRNRRGYGKWGKGVLRCKRKSRSKTPKGKKEVVVWKARFQPSKDESRIEKSCKSQEEAKETYDRLRIEHWGVPVDPKRTLNFPERLEEYLAEINK